LDGLTGNVLSLYAKGMTTGDIQAYLAEIYDTEISRDTISRITDAVVEDLIAWQSRPLDAAWRLGMVANVRERTFRCLAGHTTSCRHRSGSATSS
jgi:putative transposase